MALCLQPVDMRTTGWPGVAFPGMVGSCGEGNLQASTEDLTTVSLDGSGVFDVLMQATKLHLKDEFDSGRITGKEYSTVYLGALNSVLAQSVQFLMHQQQIEKINAEIGLLRQKTVTELAQTEDDLPLGLGFNGMYSDEEGWTINIEGLLSRQIDLFAKQTEGYDRDAEQKLARIMTDSFASQIMVEYGGTSAAAAGLDSASMRSVIDGAKAGHGLA